MSGHPVPQDCLVISIHVFIQMQEKERSLNKLRSFILGKSLPHQFSRSVSRFRSIRDTYVAPVSRSSGEIL